uniref:Major facilitator superfamily (MFS) profile domain-containing protein n=1 Tax=Leersia perrieri TaxID=77586 RepID=A0A0D9UZP8_9ORYZ
MTGDGDVPLLVSCKVYHEHCPGCRQERKVHANDRLPYLDFLYIWIACLCSALPIQSLFPYLYFMIRDLKVAKQEQDIGFYAGFVAPCIVQAYASEVCRKEHQALGISLPATKYPNLFSEQSIFGRFPYFLPSFVISVLAAGACVACIWLPETLHMHHDDKVEAIDALEAQDGTAKESGTWRMGHAKNLLRNRQLMSAITLYCVFSLHDTAYLEIFSLWSVSSRKYRGLGFTSQDVGVVLAISGFGVLVYQLAIYPLLAKYVGPIKPFRSAAVLSILLLSTYPFMANLYGLELKVLINVASLLKNMFAATITIACNILQNTAVTQEQRGVANGISVTLMSIFKAVAPAVAGILFSWAQKHITGLFLPGEQILFLMLNMVSVIGFILTFKPFFSLPDPMQ